MSLHDHYINFTRIRKVEGTCRIRQTKRVFQIRIFISHHKFLPIPHRFQLLPPQQRLQITTDQKMLSKNPYKDLTEFKIKNRRRVTSSIYNITIKTLAIFNGAGNGNRTRVSSMASWCNSHYTIPAHSLERTTGIEPASPAWKAGIITIIRRPRAFPYHTILHLGCATLIQGFKWEVYTNLFPFAIPRSTCHTLYMHPRPFY